MSFSFHILGGVVCLYLIYLLACLVWQRHIIYPRQHIAVSTTDINNLPNMEKWWCRTSLGKIEAWYIPPLNGGSQEQQGAVIFAHGNGELIDFWPQLLYGFPKMGLGLLLVEYPGYGRSQGSPSQQTIREAMVAAYDKLTSMRTIDPRRVVFFGRSLGGGVVCDLARYRIPGALILMSTFTSIRSFAWQFLVPPAVIRDNFDNLSFLRTYTRPVLIIHGVRDQIVPFRHGQALHEAAPQSKLLRYECGHNDCPPSWDQFWNDIVLFLRESHIICGDEMR